MAVMLEFINVIVPRSVIEKKYPGGWVQCLSDECGMWHDDNLLRDGAMSQLDIEGLISFWSLRGLKPMKSVKGEKVWNEICVVDAMSNTPTLPCDWLEISEDGSHAWLKGSPPGAIAMPKYYMSEDDVLEDDDWRGG